RRSGIKLSVLLAVALWPLPAASQDGGWQGPIIDAHSQVDQHVDLDGVVPLLDRAGVARVILSTRGRIRPHKVAALARSHPDRIIASVRTKGWAYYQNSPKYHRLLNVQLAMPEFRAMAEILLWHGAKGDIAPELVVPAAAPQVQVAVAAAYRRGWPVVLHYEFAAAASAAPGLMTELEGVLRERPDHPFVLTHMGQLDVRETRRLIEAHGNIHFIPSWSNPVAHLASRQPWVNLFDGRRLAPAWKALILDHPDRLVLGFDNVFAEHWGGHYVAQARLWREALAELPDDVAHAVAHGNAERLWRLDPL
ncbi:MAG: amidohydrolase family protein, partial [Alphaproteobacteria bacterium]|nr:amidohydrolase family protein [Alphaproteobacteria bacterium]